MANEVHKFYCHGCKRAIFGASATMLATHLNEHAVAYHPMDFCGWSAQSIVQSNNYSGPTTPPAYLAIYTHPERQEWGGAKPPDITERDRIILSRNKIKWD